MSDMISRLVMKVDGWVAPIAEAKGELIDLDGTTKQVFSSLREAMNMPAAKSPLSSLIDAKSSISDAGNAWNSFLSNTSGVDNYTEATLYLFQTIRASTNSLGEAKSSIQDVGRAWRSSGQESIQAQRETTESTTLLSKASQAAGIDLAELAGVVGKKAVLGYLAYKLGIDEVIQASRAHLAENSALRQSVGGVLTSVQDLTSTITGSFIGGVKASLMAVVELTTGYGSFEDMVNDGAATLTSWANSATAAIKSVNAQAKDLALIGSTALAVFHGADASAFYEQGQALNQMAEATANVIQKQEQQRASLDYITNAAQGAASSQKTAAEVARISTIGSVAALDQELQALKLKTLEQDKSVTGSKAWQQQITQITAAIEKQRSAIEGGTFKPKDSGVDQQIKAAEEALNRLAVGETEAAIAIARANGASDEQISRLRAAMVATDDLTRAKKEQEEAERKAADAQRDAAAKFAQGKNTIQSLKDEIDLLTGAATKSEVAARKLMSEGYDTAQIEEITRLTEQLEQLKAGKSGSKSDRQGNNVAVEKGSAEANAIMLRGVGGSSGNKSEKLQEQTVKGLQEVVKAIKETKPAIELQTADI